MEVLGALISVDEGRVAVSQRTRADYSALRAPRADQRPTPDPRVKSTKRVPTACRQERLDSGRAAPSFCFLPRRGATGRARKGMR